MKILKHNTVKQKISFSYCRNYLITVKGEINPTYNVIFIFIGASILWNSFILKSILKQICAYISTSICLQNFLFYSSTLIVRIGVKLLQWILTTMCFFVIAFLTIACITNTTKTISMTTRNTTYIKWQFRH
jgi:hypothetical protein